MERNTKEIDILCVGEVLIDFIGHQEGALINDTRDYHRYVGGSPSNVAMNVARLGLHAALVATVGKDGFGDYIFNKLRAANVNVDFIRKNQDTPTTVIFVSRTADTPDFLPFRYADWHIAEDQITEGTLKNTKIFHTSCFALSKEPAQATILKKAEAALNLGCTLSIDVNYSSKLWDSQDRALQIIKAYCKFNPLVKISEDDMQRLFGQSLSHDEIFNFFHAEGVETVCLTLGSEGVKLSQYGQGIISLPAVKVNKIKDATGAGDAFWSGFLFAYLNEKSMEQCLEVGLNLAALKLQYVGNFPDDMDLLSKIL